MTVMAGLLEKWIVILRSKHQSVFRASHVRDMILRSFALDSKSLVTGPHICATLALPHLRFAECCGRLHCHRFLSPVESTALLCHFHQRQRGLGAGAEIVERAEQLEDPGCAHLIRPVQQSAA